MQAVGSILQNYDTDQKFPLYGFGGTERNAAEVMHCFALNGNIFNPEVMGIDNCISAYQASLQRYSLFGPTWFSSVLN
jgi:hypothetical protein